MSGSRFSLAASALALASWSCAASPTPVGPLEAGTWGGDHVLVSVGSASASASFEFDCAHGSTDAAITLDRNGRFRAAGLLVAEGGPVREPPEAGSPVVYEGERHGRQLDFSVTRSGESRAIGSFTAFRGATPRLLKCL